MAENNKNNILLRLPCNVGDIVWCLVSENTKIVECTVLWIEIHKNGVVVFALDGGFGDVIIKHLGKTLFITKEEAEQKLAELNI